jgi:molybdenum cofactor synthesis domain-containing protein
MPPPSRRPTAAVVVIGDEILSGKVAEANLALLIPMLRQAGVELRRVAIIPDDVAAIAEEVGRCAAAYDVVITSGGIGPTHDDVTVAGVARAFGLPVTRNAELERLVRQWWGERLTDAALRLAEVPAGARLLPADDGLLPLVAVHNVYLMPGVPALFARKLATLHCQLGGGTPPTLMTLTIAAEETAIAELLSAVAAAFPQVAIGSYPQGRAKVWVTFEGSDPHQVAQACHRLAELLPPGTVV